MKNKIPKSVKLKTYLVTILLISVIFAGALNYALSITYIGDVTDVYVLPPLHEASYVVGVYNSTFYYGQNGIVGEYEWLSTNDDTVLQNCIDTTNSDGGGSVYVKAGTYSASVTIKATVLLVLEAGVSGVTYSVDSGGYCIRYSGGYAWFEQPLNMTGHEIQFGAFHTGTSSPASPNTGQWWYDTNTYNLKIYNGTDWATVQGAQGSQGEAGTLEGQQPYDYLVFINATSTYMINGTTAVIDFNGSPSATINNALGNATGTVLLCSGTYTLTGDTGLTMDTNDVVLRGMGYSTSLECEVGFDDHIIHVTADYVTVCDLQIDGTNQAVSYHGIVEDGNGNGGLFVHHVRIYDCGSDGICLGDEDSSWEANWGKIHHVVLKNNGRYGMHFTYDATDSELLDFLMSGHDGAGDAGICVGCDNIRINTGHLWGNEYEMKIAEHDYAGRGSVNGLIVSNVGIMDGGSQGQHRIYHDSAKNFINSAFTGCEIWVAKLAGVDTYDGFHLSGDTWCVSITGCVFRGDNESDTKQGRYGIYMDSSVHNCTIIANTFEAFTQADPIYTTGALNLQEGYNIVYNCG